ncbi:MAG: hypothetical protein ACLSG5_10165 [Oscillospiraceae bacterium]|nr:hypothetical protein [Eubacterium sp.]
MGKKAWVKEFIGASAFGGAWLLLTLLIKMPIFASIIPFVFIDCILGYIFKNRILTTKAYLKVQANMEERYFNSEYYDLYYDFNYNRIIVLSKSLILALVVNSILGQFIDSYEHYIVLGIMLMFVIITVVSIVVFSRKRDQVIMRLISLRNKNWFGEYTPEETEIIMKLGEKLYEKSGS